MIYTVIQYKSGFRSQFHFVHFVTGNVSHKTDDFRYMFCLPLTVQHQFVFMYLLQNCVHGLLLFIITDSYSISEGNSYTRTCSSNQYLTINSCTYSCFWSSTGCTSKANSNCGYPTSCTLYASNSWVGSDPCPGMGKTLTWSDSCNSKSRTLISLTKMKHGIRNVEA